MPEGVQTKVDLDRELDEWDRRHPGLKPDERFVAWFVRAYSTDDETKAMESLSGSSGEKGIDALLIDDSNDLVTVVQGKYRDSIMGRAEKPADVMEFANLAKALSAEDKEFRRFLKDLEPLAARRARSARQRLREKSYRLNLHYATLGKCSKPLVNRARAAARSAAADLNRVPHFQVFDGNDVLAVLDDYLDGVAPPVPSLQLDAAGPIGYEHDNISGVASWIFSMNGLKVGKLLESVGDKLFARNIRGHLGENRKVNKAIRDTISRRPESFFFLNNGITVICDSADPGTEGGIQYLEVFKPQIINGQQTTYALFDAGNQARKAKVVVRVIGVKDRKPKGWADYETMVSSVVEATNSQNTIKASDLRSNDRVQVRLQRDLRKLGYFYIRKAGRAAEWDLAIQGQPRVKKEDVARAAMACESAAALLNEGVQSLFEEDATYKQLFRLTPKQALCRWWLMRAVDSQARGVGERQAAKFLVLQFVWHELGADIEANEDAFIDSCRRGAGQVVTALDRVIAHAMKGAIQHYQKDRASGPTPLEVNPFFKRRDRFERFQSFWRSKRSSHKKNFTKAANDFRAALKA